MCSSPSQSLSFDTWHKLEFYVVRGQGNTNGQKSDGLLEAWIDDSLWCRRTELNILGEAYSSSIHSVLVGEQADREIFRDVDEKRYWDDIEIWIGQ
jgi:hypothetical protein